MQSDCRRNDKCLRKCGSKWHFLPGTFYGHFESAWDSADATNTSFPGTSYQNIKSAWWNAMICFCWQILPKCHNLRISSHFGEILWFTRFVAFWWNVAIYAYFQAKNLASQALKTITQPCRRTWNWRFWYEFWTQNCAEKTYVQWPIQYITV